MKRYKRLYFTLLSLTSIFLLLKFALPYFLRPSIEDFLSKFTQKKVSIEKLTLSPLRMEFIFSNISLNQKLFIEHISLKLSVFQLLTKEVKLIDVLINKVNLSTSRDNNLVFIEGLKTIHNSYSKKVVEKIKDYGLKFNIENFKGENILINLFKKENINILQLNIDRYHSLRPSLTTTYNIKANIGTSDFKSNGKFRFDDNKQYFDFYYNLKNFKLSFLNSLNREIPKTSGNLTLKTRIKGNQKNASINSQFTLNNFKLFSKDLKTVDYFIRSLSVKNLDIQKHKGEINLHTPSLKMQNFIMSISTKNLFKKKSFSKSGVIELNDIIFNLNQISDQISFKANYNKTGKILVIKSSNKEETIQDVKLENLDLTPFGETFEEILRYHIKSGSLNLSLKTKSINKKVDGKMQFTLNQLDLDEENELGQTLKETSSIPLKTALSMITNDNGGVDMEVDISGNEDNPEFGFSSLLKKGIGSMILSEVTSLIATKVAIKLVPMLVTSMPFSPTTAFSIVKGGIKLLIKPRFKEIFFVVNKAKIQNNSQADLQKVLNFLSKNSTISLNFCIKVFSKEVLSKKNLKRKDHKDLSPQKSLDLARKRQELIRNILLKNKKIKLRQAVFCRPKISKDIVGTGHMEISL